MPHRSSIPSTIAAALAILASAAAAQTGRPGEQEIGRTTEREVKVVISSTFGHVRIGRGEPEKIVIAEADNNGSSRMHLSYSIRNRVGYLEITLGEESDGERKHGAFRVHDIDGGTWTLRFGTAITAASDDGVRFTVLVDGTPVWSGEQKEQPAAAHEADLSAWAGRSVPLTLRVNAVGTPARDWANWVQPQVVVLR